MAPIISPKARRPGGGGWQEKIYIREDKGVEDQAGRGEDRALMSRFHKPPGVKTKAQTCTLPNFRAVWKRGKKKNNNKKTTS